LKASTVQKKIIFNFFQLLLLFFLFFLVFMVLVPVCAVMEKIRLDLSSLLSVPGNAVNHLHACARMCVLVHVHVCVVIIISENDFGLKELSHEMEKAVAVWMDRPLFGDHL
jgi:hypothetical protein